MSIPWELLPLFFLVAFLYSSVGHGGASGYLALFALFGIASPSIAPVALVLNILVASTSFGHFYRGGFFSWKMLAPFVLTSIPAAFVGGFVPVSQQVFSLILGIALLLASARILLIQQPALDDTLRPVDWRWSLLIGAGLGFISGMIGIGGGVFLSPLLLLLRWADVKRTAAISSAFIVLNSVSGLAGHFSRSNVDFTGMIPLLIVVVAGGILGSRSGAFHIRARTLQIILALVLAMAALKLIAKVFG